MTGAAAPAGRRVAAVIVAWNGREDVLACLASLRAGREPPDAALVVDNASSDGTAEAVRREHPWAEVIPAGANLGYAGGANAGLRRALEGGFRWALLLNQDTVLEPGALAALREAGEARPEAAALQPLLLDAAEPGRVDSLGIRVLRSPGARDEGRGTPAAAAPAGPTPIFGACAAAVLLRCDAVREAGLLEEDFFLIFEDVDLAFRLRAAGGEAVLVPAARVLHRRGISGGGRDPGQSRLRRCLLHRNLTALALRWWPAGALLRSAHILAAGALRALLLRRAAPGRPCLPLWRRHLAARPESRRAMAARSLDRWFS